MMLGLEDRNRGRLYSRREYRSSWGQRVLVRRLTRYVRARNLWWDDVINFLFSFRTVGREGNQNMDVKIMGEGNRVGVREVGKGKEGWMVGDPCSALGKGVSITITYFVGSSRRRRANSLQLPCNKIE